MPDTVERTEFFRFKKPPLNHRLYHDEINGNFDSIDALLHRYIAVNNFQGLWENSTAYTVGQTVADVVSGLVYIALVIHTSASDPTLFSEDRLAHPTYWEEYNTAAVDYASQALDSANDALAAAAAAVISAANAAASAAAAALSGGDMLKANNLSELTDMAIARASLQLQGMAQQNPATVAITGGSLAGVTGVQTFYNGGTAGGTVNAMTCTSVPPVPSLADGTVVLLRAAGANTSTTVTFAPDGLTAKNIRRSGNRSLQVSSIYGAGHDLLLRFNAANDLWELLNPRSVTIWDCGTAGGAADVITATAIPAVTVYVNGHMFRTRAASANATTTPTININSLGAKTITKLGGQALAIGDIYGAGHELLFVYNSTSGFMELLNPAVPLATQAGAKAWGSVTQSAGVYTLETGSFNITSIAKNSTGNVTVTIATDLADAKYAVLVTTGSANVSGAAATKLAGSFVAFLNTNTTGAPVDAAFSFVIFGA